MLNFGISLDALALQILKPTSLQQPYSQAQHTKHVQFANSSRRLTRECDDRLTRAYEVGRL